MVTRVRSSETNWRTNRGASRPGRAPMDRAGLIHAPAIDRHQPGEVARDGRRSWRWRGSCATARSFRNGRCARKRGNSSLPLTGTTSLRIGKPICRATTAPIMSPKLPLGTAKTIGSPGLGQPRGGVEIINALRQQPADVDRVGGGERNVLQRRIGKGAFHHRLAVVELAVDRHGADVARAAWSSACAGWSLTSPIGNSTMTRMPATLWNALATAEPVSPLVAVRMVSCWPSSRRKRPMSRAIMRAAKSLNDAVGPRSSRMT